MHRLVDVFVDDSSNCGAAPAEIRPELRYVTLAGAVIAMFVVGP
jgi:hypothetical protein